MRALQRLSRPDGTFEVVVPNEVPFAASDPRFEPLVLDDLRVRAGEVVDIGEIRLRLRTPP